MSAIMSQNGRKMAKMLHSAAKKFDWVVTLVYFRVQPLFDIYIYLGKMGHFKTYQEYGYFLSQMSI